MAGYDGTLKFDTKIDESGFNKGTQNIGDNLGNAFSRGMSKIKKLGIGLAVAGIGKKIVDVGMTFEEQMSKVQAISGNTAQGMQPIIDKAKQLGIDTRFSATEAGQAFQYMAMAGWDTEEMLNGVDAVMNLASASGEDLAMVSDIVTDSLTAFGLKASDASHYADILAQASRKSNTNVAMMGETFKYVAPVAGALGYSVEDTALAIGLMANAGIKGSQAGTSLRSILTRLAKPVGEVSGAMKELGISVTDSTGKMKPFRTVLGDLRKAFSGLSEEQKAQYATTLAGKEGMSALLAIVNASEDDFNSLADAIDNSDGSAKEMADVMQDNLKGSLDLLKSSLESVGIAIMEGLQKPFQDAVSNASENINALVKAYNDAGAKGLYEAGITMMNKLGDGLRDSVPLAVNKLVTFIDNFNAFFKNHATEIFSAGANILQNLIQGFMDGIPVIIGRLADFVVTFVSWFDQNRDTIMQAGTSMIRSIIEGFFSAVQEFIGRLPELTNALYTWILENPTMLIEFGIEIVTDIVKGVIESIPMVIEAIPQIITAFGQALFEHDWIGDGKKIIQGLIDGVNGGQDGAYASGQNASNSTKKGVDSVSLKGSGVGKLKEIAGGVLSGSKNADNAGKQTAKAVQSGTNKTDIKSAGKKKSLEIASGVNDGKGKCTSAGTNVANGVKGAVNNVSFHGCGLHICSGISAGIDAGAGGLLAKASNLAHQISSKIRNALKIKSPSRVMRDQVGRWIPAGIAVGFEKDMPKSADKMVASLNSEMGRLRDTAMKDMSISTGGTETVSKSVEGQKETSYIINQTFNNKKNTSPYDMARETINAQRRLKWEA